MRGRHDFAVFGGKPTFDTGLHVAQTNLPEVSALEAMVRRIFQRRYFANHGPLVSELDRRVAAFLGVRHAICVTNGTVGLMLLAKALGIDGDVVVPAFTFPATAQALLWAGLRPVLCDVDPTTHMVSVATVEAAMTPRTSAILGVHLWGDCCPVDELAQLAADRRVSLIYDACHGFACRDRGRPVGSFGRAEVFSFHATKILNAAEGGCICTDDADLAARLRTMRNFHASQTFVSGLQRMNGKMSEIQAGLALLSLDQLPANLAANQRRFDAYAAGLGGLDGVHLRRPSRAADETNFQYIVLEIDAARVGIDRDALLRVLAAENVVCRRHFFPGLHRTAPFDTDTVPGGRYPATDHLSSCVIQLPNSQTMTPVTVATLCTLVRDVIGHADSLRTAR